MQVNNIQNTQLINNNKKASFKGGREILRTFANPDSLATTIALETSVTGGRGINAYKRGGKNEFRERFIDDVVSAVFWMKGVDIFNKMGDWFGKNVLKLPFTEFDLGKDALRNPVKNLENKIAETGVSGDALKNLHKKHQVFKLSKIIPTSVLATAFVGFALPKINQGITDRIMSRNKMENKMDNKILEQNKIMPYNVMKEHSFEAFDKKLNTKKSQSFKGVPIAAIAHTLENNKIAKMLTTDVGIITGRVTTARNADEAREYLFRDSMSPIFYYASTPLIYKGLQAITKSANTTNIDPVAAKEVTDIMLEQVKANGGHMQVEEFAARTIGTLDDKAKEFLDNLPFQTGEADKKGIFTKVADFFRGLFKVKKPMQEVISLAALKKHLTDAELLKKAEEMAKLQPEQAGIGAVLTKQQVADVLKNGSINAPKFMQKLFKGKFGEDLLVVKGGTYTNGPELAARYPWTPWTHSFRVGFRCVKDIKDE